MHQYESLSNSRGMIYTALHTSHAMHDRVEKQKLELERLEAERERILLERERERMEFEREEQRRNFALLK